MGDPVTILAVAGAATSAFGAVQQGQAAKAASAFERQQYEEEMENNRLGALQDENARRRELAATLAAQEVYFGANGIDPNGPTAQALRDETVGLAEEDIETSKLNFANRGRRMQLAAGQSASAGKAAAAGGYLKAAGGLLQFGSQWAQTGGIPKTPSGNTGFSNYGMTKTGDFYG